MMNKKAVSLMISYVILISIVLGLAVGIYSWLSFVAKDVGPAPDCKEETSLIIIDQECDKNTGQIKLNIKNNGRFNVDGFIFSVGDDPSKAPTHYIYQKDYEEGIDQAGYYYFGGGTLTPLKPGESAEASFVAIDKNGEDLGFSKVKIARLQPFIILNQQNIVCQNSVVTQEIENCIIRPCDYKDNEGNEDYSCGLFDIPPKDCDYDSSDYSSIRFYYMQTCEGSGMEEWCLDLKEEYGCDIFCDSEGCPLDDSCGECINLGSVKSCLITDRITAKGSHCYKS